MSFDSDTKLFSWTKEAFSKFFALQLNFLPIKSTKSYRFNKAELACINLASSAHWEIWVDRSKVKFASFLFSSELETSFSIAFKPNLISA